jgi:DUF4097 and DUF4098 domain-containing protein YvlB
VNQIDETIPVTPGGTLVVALDRGAVEVQSHNSNTVHVEARASGWSSAMVEFGLAHEGNDVRVTGQTMGWSGWPFGARVHVRVRVPREYSVDLRTRGGSIRLTGLRGSVIAETSGGSVELTGADGPVELRTSGGSIQADDVRGNLMVRTSGGSIRLRRVVGDVDAETSGGGINVTEASGEITVRTTGGGIHLDEIAGQVEASTSGGGITAHFLGEPVANLETSGGSIDVSFPEGLGASLDARTRGGRVVVEHGMRARDELDPHHVVGEIHGGGAPLRLRTSGGSIRVCKR